MSGLKCVECDSNQLLISVPYARCKKCGHQYHGGLAELERLNGLTDEPEPDPEPEVSEDEQKKLDEFHPPTTFKEAVRQYQHPDRGVGKASGRAYKSILRGLAAVLSDSSKK